MDNTPHIRTAEKQDLETIRALSHLIWPEVYSSIISEAQISYMLEWMYNLPTLHEQWSSGSVTYLMIEDQEPLGFAGFGPGENGRYKLHKLYVLPSQHGRGLGRTLVEHIFRMLPSDCVGIELQVNKQNKAQAFYTQLGFVIESEAQFQIGNGYIMDDYIMFKPRN